MPTTVFTGSQAACRWAGRSWTEDEVVAMSPDITEQALDRRFKTDVEGMPRPMAEWAEWLAA